ncbi:MAG: prolyl oligopeptidase family serine peptidase [Bacteroidota bacterium]
MKKYVALFLIAFRLSVTAQTNYQLPPSEILALADVKTPPQNIISKNNTYLMMLERPLYKSVEELAEPELKLGGLRMNPLNFNVSRSTYYTSMVIQKISDGKPITLHHLPSPLKAQYIQFSPNETYCSFVQVGKATLSLWIINLATGDASELIAEGLNATMGGPYGWSNDEVFIYFKSKGNKQRLEVATELPQGPATQDAKGTKAPARTYQDLLRNKQDERTFNHYTQSTVQKIDISSGKITQLLGEAVYFGLAYSPDAKYILTDELTEPYSYTLPYYLFATNVNIYTPDGKLLKQFYQRALQDKTPISFDAVAPGKRQISWRTDKPSTLYWCEAPDGGNPANESTFRDEVFQSDYPFTEIHKICSIKNRFSFILFGNDNLAIVKDFWWKNRNTKTYIIDPSKENATPVVIHDVSREDLYANPGNFQMTYNTYNRQVLEFSKDKRKLYLVGEGYSPEGNKPFIDEFLLDSKTSKRLWRADGKTTYERVVKIIDSEKKIAITSVESPKIYPNLYLRNYSKKDKPQQVTFNINPYVSLQKISKQKIFYKRNDGVQLSATLFLPAEYDAKRDGRLPMLMDAYPTEYKDDKAAGQVQESPHTFISIGWYSPLFWVNRGYAVLEDAQFPIIGKGTTEPNDTYIEQLVADAEAAIKAVDSMGVVDPKRCAVMGHSYGAFMTANLLAHSNLFAAGLARSGAYNRTLTPFGFQAEERSYWEAQDVYVKMSPFNFAHKLKTPILLIHGDADNNPGTFTLQSERLFQAIKGNGGTARLVLLPYESHSYTARENILHMMWEMDSWLDKYVKQK